MEVLRQISVDNFAKRINAGLNPQGLSEDNLISTIPSGEDGNLPREVKIKSSELAGLIQAELDKQKRLNKEYKWRGHGWTRCDIELINSFSRQRDEVKKVFFGRELFKIYYYFLEI